MYVLMINDILSFIDYILLDYQSSKLMPIIIIVIMIIVNTMAK